MLALALPDLSARLGPGAGRLGTDALSPPGLPESREAAVTLLTLRSGGDAATLALRDPVIAKLEAARAALAAATSVHTVRDLLAVADAAVVYARRQQLGEEAIAYAHAIKVKALARLGELLQALPKASGGEHGGRRRLDGSRAEPSNATPTYRSLGLDKKTGMVAQQLAALPLDVRQAIAARETTLTEAQRLARRQAVVAKVQALPAGQYRVIYADPPWQYHDARALAGYVHSAAVDHYPTMATADIAALSVAGLAAPDAVLFCWAPAPLLLDALEVVRAWGFTYKTWFVWAKPRGSFGHYHKANAEQLLLATRGSCLPDVDTRADQILHASVGRHSEKPAAMRALIDTLYPHGPRIELFARQRVAGWAAWGAELAPA